MESITFGNQSFVLIFSSATGKLEGIIFNQERIELNSLLWKLEIKGEGLTQQITMEEIPRFQFQVDPTRLELVWQNDDLSIKIKLSSSDLKVYWTIEVECLSGKYLINKVIFPILGGLKGISPNSEEDYLLLPWQNGVLIQNPIHEFIGCNIKYPFWAGRGGYKYENEYPAQFSYQYSAYYSPNRYGFYFCIEDGEAYIKTMGFYYTPLSSGMDFMVTNYPEEMGNVTKYVLPYRFVLQMFIGDWQTATSFYREWAIQQNWCRKTLRERNLPDNLLKTDLWRINHRNFSLGKRTNEFYRTTIDLKEKLACNIALHWYGWNMGEHDVNYPEYISRALVGWPEKLSQWNDRFTGSGIVKIPYINARLWDANSPSWEGEKAYEAAIKDEFSQTIDEKWNPNSALTPMCPSTQLWQETVQSLGSHLVRDLKFDGLYLDQVASYNATLCFDHSHPHPYGGGKWWNASYHSMIWGLRDRVGEDKILTTESCCESYVDLFDVFLIVDTTSQKYFSFTDPFHSESIPLFSMIYGSHALSYGSNCTFSDSLEEFEFNFIRNLLWGFLPTIEGIDAEQLNKTNAKDYLDIIRKGVNFFKENKNLFIFGRLLEILHYKCESVQIPFRGDKETIVKNYPAILATLWQNDMGEKYLLVYNFSGNEQVVTIKNVVVRLPGKELIKKSIHA